MPSSHYYNVIKKLILSVIILGIIVPKRHYNTTLFKNKRDTLIRAVQLIACASHQ